MTELRIEFLTFLSFSGYVTQIQREQIESGWERKIGKWADCVANLLVCHDCYRASCCCNYYQMVGICHARSCMVHDLHGADSRRQSRWCQVNRWLYDNGVEDDNMLTCTLFPNLDCTVNWNTGLPLLRSWSSWCSLLLVGHSLGIASEMYIINCSCSTILGILVSAGAVGDKIPIGFR